MADETKLTLENLSEAIMNLLIANLSQEAVTQDLLCELVADHRGIGLVKLKQDNGRKMGDLKNQIHLNLVATYGKFDLIGLL